MNTLLLSAILLCAAPAQETVRYPAKPGPREFILDEAKLLKSEDAAEIRTLCDEALSRKRAPIIVVTIPSLASYGAATWPIERYAMNLMSEWGVGWEDWNYGMLLLVSPGNRKARIELGGSWARRKDDETRRLMTQKIIPKFKTGDYSKGILEGVRGLHSITLDAVPSRTVTPSPVTPSPVVPSPVIPSPDPQQFPVSGIDPSSGCLPVGGIGLIVILIIGVVIVSMISRAFRGGVQSWGGNGPGYYGGGGYHRGGGFGSSFGGGMLGGALGSMIGNSISNRGHSSSSGGYTQQSSAPPPSSSSSSDSSFGGGSFGGGFSGGGGATGEW